MYHTAPNTQFQLAFALGMDVEIMPRFDPEELLRVIVQRRIEHVQAVPTMFVRLLKPPVPVREQHDLSSLTAVVHAAAACPPDIKRAIIDWFGPIVHEYYAVLNPVLPWCSSEEWLAHPGTVGRPVTDAAVRIIAADGSEAAVGEPGDIYLRPFSAWLDFTYLGDDAKRRAMENDGFVTVGDIGYVDADGFLYLSDRRNDMISPAGSTSIRPRSNRWYSASTEWPTSQCSAFPIRISVKPWRRTFNRIQGRPSPTTTSARTSHVARRPSPVARRPSPVARRLARYKVPKVVVFEDVPREDTGKLFKRRLKAHYWEPHTSEVPTGHA
jgi:long-chain acyl-CoA synthetase